MDRNTDQRIDRHEDRNSLDRISGVISFTILDGPLFDVTSNLECHFRTQQPFVHICTYKSLIALLVSGRCSVRFEGE